jgi:hypothetical protein
MSSVIDSAANAKSLKNLDMTQLPNKAAAEPAFMYEASLLDLRAHCQPSLLRQDLLRQDTSLPFGTVIGDRRPVRRTGMSAFRDR